MTALVILYFIIGLFFAVNFVGHCIDHPESADTARDVAIFFLVFPFWPIVVILKLIQPWNKK